MSRTAIRRWYLVHKWTSLVCTAFLLMLCVTGLPLIFHEELDQALGNMAPIETVAPGTPRPPLDTIISAVLATRRGEVVQFVDFDAERPIATVITGPSADAPETATHLQPVDLRTSRFVAPPPQRTGFLFWMEEAHERMFLGPGGTLFLGRMGTFFSSPHHYNIFMAGATPVISKLLRPTLIDAATCRLTDVRDMPLPIQALFLARPLHFGDYGGLGLKFIWALLDLVAIVTLGSGVYLWLGRKQVPAHSTSPAAGSR